MSKITTTFLLFFITSTAVFSQNAYENLQIDSLQIGAYSRTFLYHKPTNLPNKPKLVFVLHGSGGSGKLITQFTEHWFSRLADERGDALFPDTDKADGTTAKQFTIKHKKYDIRLIQVENGGHVLSVPTKIPPPPIIGKSIRDINMAQVVFDFFF